MSVPVAQVTATDPTRRFPSATSPSTFGGGGKAGPQSDRVARSGKANSQGPVGCHHWIGFGGFWVWKRGTVRVSPREATRDSTAPHCPPRSQKIKWSTCDKPLIGQHPLCYHAYQRLLAGQSLKIWDADSLPRFQLLEIAFQRVVSVFISGSSTP